MQNWEYKKLGDVCDFQGGSQPPKDEWIKEPKDGYIRMLQIRDFTQSRNFDIEYVKITERLRYCNKDDILLGRYGASVGKVLTGLEGVYNVAILKTIPADYLYKPFVKFYFMSPLFQQPLLFLCNQRAAQAGFNKEDINDFSFPLPPLEEQKRIVKILDEKFAMLETVKANAKTNLQNAKDLFQSQLTKAFMEGSNPSTCEAGVSSLQTSHLPQHALKWEKKRLGNICSKIGSGATPKGGKDSYKSEGIHLVRSMNVYDNEFVYNELACLDDNQAYELRNVELQENDVLFNITGASVCRCCVLPSDVLPARVNQHVSILRPNNKILNPLFLCYSMIGPYHEDLYKMACSGGSTRQAITKKQLEDFEVYVPSLEEQQTMIERIDSLSEKVRSLEEIYTKQLANCDELKQAFLAKAFAGEL